MFETPTKARKCNKHSSRNYESFAASGLGGLGAIDRGCCPKSNPLSLAKCLAAFDEPDWLFELKHDGFRSLAYLEDGRCRLVSRHRNAYKSFETLRDALAGLRAKNAILDGEIVALDSNGMSQFKELLYRRGRAVFFAFDLVWLDGMDLRQTPLSEKKIETSSAVNVRRFFTRSKSTGTANYCSRKCASGTSKAWLPSAGWERTRNTAGSR